MKLLYLTPHVTVFGNYYLYATFEGESGKTFTSKEPYMWARSKKLLDEKLSKYPPVIVQW